MGYLFRLGVVSNDTEAPRKNKNPAAMRGGGQRDASSGRLVRRCREEKDVTPNSRQCRVLIFLS